MMSTIYVRVYHRISKHRRYGRIAVEWQDKVQNFCARKIRASGGL